jgi:hypothetical protein
MFKYTSIPTKVDTCRFVINTNMSEKNFNEIKEHRHSYVCFADSKCKLTFHVNFKKTKKFFNVIMIVSYSIWFNLLLLLFEDSRRHQIWRLSPFFLFTVSRTTWEYVCYSVFHSHHHHYNRIYLVSVTLSDDASWCSYIQQMSIYIDIQSFFLLSSFFFMMRKWDEHVHITFHWFHRFHLIPSYMYIELKGSLLNAKTSKAVIHICTRACTQVASR